MMILIICVIPPARACVIFWRFPFCVKAFTIVSIIWIVNSVTSGRWFATPVTRYVIVSAAACEISGRLSLIPLKNASMTFPARDTISGIFFVTAVTTSAPRLPTSPATCEILSATDASPFMISVIPDRAFVAHCTASRAYGVSC